ncbi:adenylate cyclase [Frankia sp. CNm7]|uniref:Adenylate cyclase n=1 Tax=Frankia nepalensis TaxID=1836974 RepID=A0A937RXM3_9ACTN|nr:adenylate cyclase [Frankia nepalensis]MBL7499561.1 adenylate cyclase [Frankia nepalensis]MBL7513189.1 adenylate cyclase [Frankia nepalensis]MBL7517584.1 adenylate cyclase [Frankia nepalensis]MBL7633671.1 adenylate cyclase [Frankia nepalensis]
MSEARRFWRLPEHELDDLVALARQVDRVELKLTVPGPAHEAVRAALGLKFPRAPRHQVYYFDNPDQLLRQHGVIIRARRRRNQPDDAVVKLRPAAPADIPPAIRASKRFVVEVDGMPGSYVCSAALKTHLGSSDIERVVRHGRSPRRLLSAAQLRLLDMRLSAAHVDLADLKDLRAIGPVRVHRHTLRPTGCDVPFLAECWTYPDNSQLLELSTRCHPREVLSAAAHTATVLTAHGIDLTGPQQTKTVATYQFFDALGTLR